MENLLGGILLIFLKPIIEKIMNSILDRFTPGDTIIALRLLLQSMLALSFSVFSGYILSTYLSLPAMTGADSVGVALWMALLFTFFQLARKRWMQFRAFYKRH